MYSNRPNSLEQTPTESEQRRRFFALLQLLLLFSFSLQRHFASLSYWISGSRKWKQYHLISYDQYTSYLLFLFPWTVARIHWYMEKFTENYFVSWLVTSETEVILCLVEAHYQWLAQYMKISYMEINKVFRTNLVNHHVSFKQSALYCRSKWLLMAPG